MADNPRTTEGALIHDAVERSPMSASQVAAQIPASETQLRDWLGGYDAAGDEIDFPAAQLAAVAGVLHIPALALRAVERDDAADLLDEQADPADLTDASTPALREEIARRTGEYPSVEQG